AMLNPARATAASTSNRPTARRKLPRNRRRLLRLLAFPTAMAANGSERAEGYQHRAACQQQNDRPPNLSGLGEGGFSGFGLRNRFRGFGGGFRGLDRRFGR